MYEGRELDIVSQAETIEPWRKLHEDLGCLSQGLAMAEATEAMGISMRQGERLWTFAKAWLRNALRHQR